MKFASLILTLICGQAALACAAETRPNIIVILADDLGWADVGFNGCREIPTPNLDALAKSGVRCTAGFASHSYCSPSRAGLLTGRHQQRFGHEGNPNQGNGLPLTETLLPALLKKQNYRTAAIGKWHLGDEEQYWPIHRGFDEWFGFTGGNMTYWGKDEPAGSGVLRNGLPVPKSELTYLTDDFTTESCAFIERHKEQPFFLYLAYNAPHSPNQATKAHLQKTAHIEQPSRAVYGALVAGMDAGVGRILRQLEELKLRERTLIIFASDNGGRVDGALNFPYRGFKGMLFDGGIRVPFCVSWPTQIPAGQTLDTPITGLDVFPTVLAAAGARVPADLKLDGWNLLPALSEPKRKLPERTLIWRYSLGRDGFGYAVRGSTHKLVCVNAERTLLFDLAADPYEQHDLAAAQPETVKRLTAEYERWASEMQPPLWHDPHGSNIRNDIQARQTAVEQASNGERSP